MTTEKINQINKTPTKLKPIKIALVNKTQKVWFIRANSGIYSKHFKSANIIAISHLEDIFNGTIGKEIPSIDEMQKSLLANENYSTFKKDKEGKEKRH